MDFLGWVGDIEWGARPAPKMMFLHPTGAIGGFGARKLPLGGSSHDSDTWLYNNHGDRFRPLRIGVA